MGQAVPSAADASSRSSVLRGIVMILMALDHVRDYVGVPANPTDPATASVALFFTRWITHLCAPTFFLLTGVGGCAVNMGTVPVNHEGDSPYSIHASCRGSCSTRGAWLIVLELTVVRCLGCQFNFDYRVTMLVHPVGVGLGDDRAGGARVPADACGNHVRRRADRRAQPSRPGQRGVAWRVRSDLVDPARARRRDQRGRSTSCSSPIRSLPWIGVTRGRGMGWGRCSVGRRIAAGDSCSRSASRCRSASWSCGRSTVTAIPCHGRVQQTGVRTGALVSQRQRVSAVIALPADDARSAALILWMLDAATPRLAAPGAGLRPRAPLFYFLLHLPLIHLLAVVACYARYGVVHWMFESPSLDKCPVTFPPGWGFALARRLPCLDDRRREPVPRSAAGSRTSDGGAATGGSVISDVHGAQRPSESPASWPFWPGLPDSLGRDQHHHSRRTGRRAADRERVPGTCWSSLDLPRFPTCS